MSYNNGPKIVTDGLVLCYDPANLKSYTSGSNTLFDLSATGNTASLNGGVSFTGSLRGIRGALNFDGINDYLSFARPSSIVTSGALSVSILAKWETSGSNTSSIDTLVDNNHVSSSTFQGFVLQDRPDLNQRLSFSVRPDSPGATSSFIVGHDSWYNITGTHDGTISRLYINGVLDGFATQSNGISTVQPDINIGRWQGNGGSRYFTGSVGHFLVYNRALSASEVRQNYDATRTRYPEVFLQQRDSFSPATQSWVLGPTFTITDRLYASTSSSDTGESYFNLKAPLNTAWMYCIFNIGGAGGSSAPTDVASLRDSSGNVIASIGYKRLNGRTFHMSNGVDTIQLNVISAQPLENVDWYLWLHCDKYTIRGWISRSNARPTEPIFVNQLFAGGELPRVRTQKISRFYVKASNSPQQSWDNIIVRTGPPIGDAPF